MKNRIIRNILLSGTIALCWWSALRLNSIKTVCHSAEIYLSGPTAYQCIQQEHVNVTVQGTIRALKMLDRCGVKCHIDSNELSNKTTLVFNEHHFNLPRSVKLIACAPAYVPVIQKPLS